MKVLLFSCDLNEESSYQTSIPFGLLYLASYIDRYLGEKVDFFIASHRQSVIQRNYDLAGISSMSRYYPVAVSLAKEIKKANPKTPVIVGGSHITGLPESLDPVFDAAVLGEGEKTFLEILRLYKEKGSLSGLEEIKGIAFFHENTLIKTPPRSAIEPLDSIPHPRRDLWDFSERTNWLMSSRGCPYRCVFCPGGNTLYRKFSPEYVVEEIDTLFRDYNGYIIGFRDDLCFSNKIWTAKLIDSLKARNLLGKVCFGATSRADLVDHELLTMLKELRVIRLSIGVESASQRILDYYKDGKLKIEQVQNALDLCQKYGITVEASFILGAPQETIEDLRVTYEFIFDNFKAGKLAFVPITLLTPYPGTPLWKYCEERELVGPHFDWSLLDMGLHNFNPYHYMYLNEEIPYIDFLHYLEIFEELHYNIGHAYYKSQGVSHKDAIYKHRLNRDLLNEYRKNKGLRK